MQSLKEKVRIIMGLWSNQGHSEVHSGNPGVALPLGFLRHPQENHPKPLLFWLVIKLAVDRTGGIYKAANFSSKLYPCPNIKIVFCLWDWVEKHRMDQGSARSRMKNCYEWYSKKTVYKNKEKFELLDIDFLIPFFPWWFQRGLLGRHTINYRLCQEVMLLL